MYNLLVYYPISNHFIYRLVNNIHIFIKLSILFSFLQLVLFFVSICKFVAYFFRHNLLLLYHLRHSLYIDFVSFINIFCFSYGKVTIKIFLLYIYYICILVHFKKFPIIFMLFSIFFILFALFFVFTFYLFVYNIHNFFQFFSHTDLSCILLLSILLTFVTDLLILFILPCFSFSLGLIFLISKGQSFKVL